MPLRTRRRQNQPPLISGAPASDLKLHRESGTLGNGRSSSQSITSVKLVRQNPSFGALTVQRVVPRRSSLRGPDKAPGELVLWLRTLLSPVLKTEDVSRLLGMSVEAVLRIPRSELPYADSGLGYGHRYVREDVASYARRLVARQSENMISRHSPDPLDEIVDSVRGRS